MQIEQANNFNNQDEDEEQELSSISQAGNDYNKMTENREVGDDFNVNKYQNNTNE